VYQASSTGEANSFLSSTSQAGPYGQVYPGTYSDSERGGSFTYKGLTAGYVTISIPFSLSYNISASSDPGAYASAYSEVYINLYRSCSEGGSYGGYGLSDYANYGQSFDSSMDGTLLVSLNFSLTVTRG
jgi:hypothetical protein